MEMETPTADSGTETTDTGFDMDSAVSAIGESLFPQAEPAEPDESAETPEPVAEVPPVPAPVLKAAPKSWPKEMHEHWGKTDPKVQDYWETREKQMLDGLEQYKTDAQIGKSMKDVLTPFNPILQAQGLNAPQAVNYLLNAHQRLTQGPAQSRQAAYDELGRSLGLTPTAKAADGQQAPLDPAIQSMQQKLSQIEAGLTQRQQQDYQAAQERTAKDVSAFATDPAHPYFDEVADDIVLLLKTGLPLQEAYEKAVWANPVARQKELARIQTEDATKAKENARLQALPKARAAKANVRSLDSRRAPTEPLGTWEDTMKATLAAAKTRVR